MLGLFSARRRSSATISSLIVFLPCFFWLSPVLLYLSEISSEYHFSTVEGAKVFSICPNRNSLSFLPDGSGGQERQPGNSTGQGMERCRKLWNCGKIPWKLWESKFRSECGRFSSGLWLPFWFSSPSSLLRASLINSSSKFAVNQISAFECLLKKGAFFCLCVCWRGSWKFFPKAPSFLFYYAVTGQNFLKFFLE